MGYSNISVALVHDGAVEYGVVYNPFRGEMFAAQRGKCATMNGKPIHASQYDAAHGLLLCGSTLYDRDLSDRHFAMMRALYDRCADYRRFAAAALDLCHIACGRAEIYFECRLRPWDFAAGSLVLQEAGGCVVQMDGSPLDILGNSSIFATNQPCCELLDVIRDL
jgi:myo-inositol-1(or 4)-monophosphatase